ncbi:MAG: hypothetical protein LBM96_01830 [Methanobrevibacter sp.]|jgi:hypothetical protein|nr:hypothetical protein [Candidatus Methanoflexus mossambicus]
MAEKRIDAIEFKRQLHENALKISCAKNLHEYVAFIKKVSNKSNEKLMIVEN